MIKTYEVRTHDKIMQFEIPDTWKVTYGVTQPGERVSRTRRDTATFTGMPLYTLRIYENDTKQRMIIHDVESFRDMSIPVRVGSISREQQEGAAWGNLTEIVNWEELELVEARNEESGE